MPFNPHRPRRGRAIDTAALASVSLVKLSILTAPEEAVQSALARPPGQAVGLSILTAPEEAVQYTIDDRIQEALSHFQSSPPPKRRCNSPPYSSLFPLDLQD